MAISFDGPNKEVVLSAGTVVLSVRDLWSRWVDWLLTSDNSKYLPAMTSLGGDTIDAGAGTYIPVYAWLTNGWRIRPQEADHTLNVYDGILLVDGGGDPFLNTVGDFVVRVKYSQPVQAISYDSGGGGGGLTVEQAAQLSAVFDKVTDIFRADFNRRKHDKTANTITIYGDDGVTPYKVFDADDELTEITPQ